MEVLRDNLQTVIAEGIGKVLPDKLTNRLQF